MRSLILCFFAVVLFSCICFVANGQRFYANSAPYVYGVDMGKTFYLDINNCDTPDVYQCLGTEDTSWKWRYYSDMAIDPSENLWWLSDSGRLYKRNLSDPSSCTYVGRFPRTTYINSLVSDSAGIIYAAGCIMDTTYLYKYVDTGTNKGFSTVGMLPPGFQPAGDLFFFENRLFLTAIGGTPGTFIEEIVIPDPTKSCYYMSLGNIYAFGAFSIEADDKTRVFITNGIAKNSSFVSSSLIELDIPNRVVLDTICNYPFLLGGAASVYRKTGAAATCISYPPPSTHVNANNTTNQFTLLNPSQQTIRIHSSIKPGDIADILLFDLSGRRLRVFSNMDFPDNLDISFLPKGMYILQLRTRDGIQHMEKILKD